MLFIVVIVAIVMSVGVVAIVMEAVKDMHKRALGHREKMKELEVEQLRLQAALQPPAPMPYLPHPSDTLVRRGRSDQ
jgi:hypothetical protein